MMKKIGFAAAVALVAASAMASNFRAADQVYVPAAGHISGSSSTFLSDIFVSNLSATDSVTVSVIFSNGQAGTQTVFNNLFTLAPNERREFIDFVATPQPNGLGLTGGVLGQMILNGCKAGGSCDINDTTGCPGGTTSGVCPDFRNISVESRIYAIANGANFSATTMRVKLFQGATQIGSDATLRLNPLGAVQSPLTGLFSGVALGTGTNLWIQVTQETAQSDITSDAAANGCPTGCPGFFAYGSVLDNTTTDATTLEPQYFKSITDAQLACLFPAPGQTVTCKSTPAAHRAVKHH